MGDIPTVLLKHKDKKHDPQFIRVNEDEYGFNLGKWMGEGWARVGETDLGAPPNIVTGEGTGAGAAMDAVVIAPPKKGDEVHAILKGGTKVHLVKVISVNKKDGTFVGEVESGVEKDFTFDQLVTPGPPIEGEGKE